MNEAVILTDPGMDGDTSQDVLPILLVDDSRMNLRVGQGMLEGLGYPVITAGDGQEALEVWEQSELCAIIMDCQMPEMDGFDASREIRRRERPGVHIPIIAMTASAMEGDRERCLAAGMDDYITKPVRVEELRAVLQRWVGNFGAGTDPER